MYLILESLTDVSFDHQIEPLLGRAIILLVLARGPLLTAHCYKQEKQYHG